MSRLSHRLIVLWTMPIILFTSLFFPSVAHAQTAPSSDTFIQAVTSPEMNLESFMAGKLTPNGSSGMIPILMDSLNVAIVGAYDENGNPIAGGATGVTASLIAKLYDQRPLSSLDYLAYLRKNAGIAKPAIAIGEGSKFLTGDSDQAILELWTISRNVAYLLFVVVLVVIGLMIMFRTRLNPQTVINVQLALPRIVVGLILVTFSFAIAGLIIDTVYLGHNLINTIYYKEFPLNQLDPNPDPYTLDFVGDLLTGRSFGGAGVINKLGEFIGGLGRTLFALICEIPGINKLPGSKCAKTTLTITDKIIPLIFAFTLLGTGIKIFFALITKYVTLILQTIFSPFVFLFSAIPGRQEVVSNFFRQMLSAALTFPAMAFMFYLAAYIVDSNIGLNLPSLPPLNKTGVLAPGSAQVITTADPRVLEPLIGLGILMASAQIPQALDQLLSVKAGITSAAAPDVSGTLRKIPIIGSLLG